MKIIITSDAGNPVATFENIPPNIATDESAVMELMDLINGIVRALRAAGKGVKQ